MFRVCYLRSRNAAFFAVVMLLGSACGTSQHIAKLDSDYTAAADAKIQIGTITNATGFEYDVDIIEMLSAALVEALTKNDLLATDNDANKIIINARIVEYEKGDAFKRWLMPGYGSTVLRVQCDLVEGERVIGSADAKRSVAAGGAYTIGAWKSIFKNTANDLVKDVAAKLP